MKKICMTKEEDVDDEDSIHRCVKIVFTFLLKLFLFLFVVIEGVNTCVFGNLGSRIFEKLYGVIDLVNDILRFVIFYVFNGWGLS